MQESFTASHIFISHSSDDAAVAVALCDELESQGFQCWIAPRDIPVGHSWPDAIAGALRTAEAVVMVWTGAAEQSEFVKDEILHAVNLKKRIIPLRSSDAQGIAEFTLILGRTHSIHFQVTEPRQIVPQVTRAVQGQRTARSDPESNLTTPFPSGSSTVIPVVIPRELSPAPEPVPPKRSRKLTIIIAASMIATILLVLLWNKPSAATRTEKKPVVVGIYPSDGFGKLRRAGLHAALESHQSELTIVDISEATTQEMKRGQIDAVLAKLKTILATENVLAVVGPPITEATRPVLETLANSGKRIPVIIESAGPPRLIGWDQYNDQLPIFRLHSGIDTRGRNIADFINESVKGGIKVTLLVEHLVPGEPMTYGEMMFDEIQRHLPNWNEYVRLGQIKTLNFQSDHIEDALETFQEPVTRPGVVLMLGLGTHFKAIADRYYRSSQSLVKAQAQFGSWMIGYAIGEKIHDYQADRVFEITDLDFSRTDVPSEASTHFHSVFGEVSPALRDQAFSFDAGICIIEAYRGALKQAFREPLEQYSYPLADQTFLKILENKIRKQRIHGVTGEIELDHVGRAETSSRLFYCRFDSADARWEPVKYRDILKSATTNP